MMQQWFLRRRQELDSEPFASDAVYVEIIDLIARSYGKLPCEILNLEWAEILISLHCIQQRSKRIQKMLKRKGKKSSMIFPVVNISDLADLI